MYHLMEENVLFDLINRVKVIVELSDKDQIYDTPEFISDVSQWMAKNQNILSEKYVPFAILCNGLDSERVAAFLFGIFIERAMKKHDISISSEMQPLSKEEILSKIEQNSNDYMTMLKDVISLQAKRRPTDAGKKKKKKP